MTGPLMAAPAPAHDAWGGDAAQEDLAARLLTALGSALGDAGGALLAPVWDSGRGPDMRPLVSSSLDHDAAVQDIVDDLRRSTLSGRTDRPAFADISNERFALFAAARTPSAPEPPSFGRLQAAVEDQKRAAVLRELSRRAAFEPGAVRPASRAGSSGALAAAAAAPPPDPMDRLLDELHGRAAAAASASDSSGAWPPMRPATAPRGRGPGPTLSGALPPPWAKKCYKAVAILNGRHVSIYDGSTEYAVGVTVEEATSPEHGGGIYVCASIADCLRNDAAGMPARSALLAAPRAIARVLAWTEHRHEEPVRYGHKLAFRFVRVEEMLPYPASWPSRPVGEFPQVAFPGGPRRPDVVAPAHASRPIARGESLLRAQTTTSELEEDVARMEARLRALGMAVP